MPGDDLALAFVRAHHAIDMLKRGAVAPQPRYYELFYTYARGVLPKLNGRINQLFEHSEPPFGKAVDDLYDEFIAREADSHRLQDVSGQLSARIADAQGAIGTALASADDYADTLSAASGSLDVPIPAKELGDLTDQLRGHTRSMIAENRQLQEMLARSKGEIESLQQNLLAIRREASLDPLTRLLNRRAFDESIADAVDAANAADRPLALIILDVDHFKRFNDEHGHQTGDQVLRLVAATLQAHLGGHDAAARIGGEEFAILLSQTGQDAAIRIAETLRHAIQARDLIKRSTGQTIGRVTASFGVAMLQRSEVPEALIERADQNMYSAKNAGRNKVCW